MTDNDVDYFPQQDQEPVLTQPDTTPSQEAVHDNVPILVWDGTHYLLDNNQKICSISTWNETKHHTNSIYDDDDDDDDATKSNNDYPYDAV